MRGIPATFVARREPTFAYAQAPHFTRSGMPLNIPFSDFPTDPPRDSDFEYAQTIAGDLGHRHTATNINVWWNPGAWDTMHNIVGMDDFIPQAGGHLVTPLRSSTPYGYQTPYAERFNNSGLADDTTSYNTIVDKLVAAVKLRRNSA
jgi:hypothetical protein